MCLSIFLGRNKRLPDEGTKGLVAKKDSFICSTRGSVPVGRHAKQPFLVQTKAPCINIKNSNMISLSSKKYNEMLAGLDRRENHSFNKYDLQHPQDLFDSQEPQYPLDFQEP